MRVAYIGNFEPEWSTENDVRKAFEHLGHEVIRLQENNPQIIGTLRQLVDQRGFDLLLMTSTWDDALDLHFMLDIFKRCADQDIPHIS